MIVLQGVFILVYVMVLIQRRVSTNSDKVMVNFDLKSLFPSIPIGKALEVIHVKLKADDTLDSTVTMQIIKLFQICLRSTYYLYQDQY